MRADLRCRRSRSMSRLCITLIPPWGLAGAAIGSTVALVFESAGLFLVAKYRLGLHCFIFGSPGIAEAAADGRPGSVWSSAGGRARQRRFGDCQRPARHACRPLRSGFARVRMAAARSIGRRSPTIGASLPSARLSQIFSMSRRLRLPRRRSSARAPALFSFGRKHRHGGCLASFRGASSNAAMASNCRSWSAGPTPMLRLACRWSSTRAPSRSSPPGLRISPPMKACPGCCCCRFCPRMAHLPPRCRRSCAAPGCRLPTSIVTGGRCWPRVMSNPSTSVCFMSSNRSASINTRNCVGIGGA